MELPSYDLHCHSTASDGVLSPVEIIQRAKDRRVQIISLTDHDTISGICELRELSHDGIQLIPGAEFTCQWNSKILHVLGLGLDIESTELRGYFEKLRGLRNHRAETIAARLVKQGLPDLLADAGELAAGGSIGRPHFARAMMNKNLVNNEQQAFKKYLGSGKKGDVKVEWPELNETIETIARSGGVSVLAHPTKYKMTFTKIREVVQAFKDSGGRGIEISYPGITPDQQMHLSRIANTHDLLISAGSDFHSPGQGWTDLGKFPLIKDPENHILHELLQ
ncbi:MAG: PHP domain-containing protein [Neptuniibacter sp.]